MKPITVSITELPSGQVQIIIPGCQVDVEMTRAEAVAYLQGMLQLTIEALKDVH